MEASDAFAQEISGSDDPFAGTDLAADDGFAEELDPQQTEGDIPTVDKEGRRINSEPVQEAQPAHAPHDGAQAVEPPGERPEPEQQPQAAAAPAESAADALPDAPDPETLPAPDAPEATEEEVEAKVAAEPAPDPTSPAASAGPTEDPTPPSSPSSPETTGDAGSGPTSGAPAPTEAAPVEQPGSGQGPSAESEDEFAEPPAEKKDKSNRIIKRRYLIFRVDGPGKLSEVTWYEDAKGNLATRGAGTKRQRVCLARDPDAALRFGYIAAGAPSNGIKLVAVAQLHFQPREVKPAPPQPTRTRLQIS